ncbi:MAG: MerR family transcriptional regulator [Solirubrobacteraceae bacterium]
MSTATATAESGLRIGEVARRCATTTRTIRYYEEIGLLAAGSAREAGRHRLYSDDEVERLRDVLRLKELLGVSLDELKELVEAEEARASLRAEWRSSNPDRSRRLAITEEALGHIDQQLRLVRRRRREIEGLEAELDSKRRSLRARHRKLEAEPRD